MIIKHKENIFLCNYHKTKWIKFFRKYVSNPEIVKIAVDIFTEK